MHINFNYFYLRKHKNRCKTKHFHRKKKSHSNQTYPYFLAITGIEPIGLFHHLPWLPKSEHKKLLNSFIISSNLNTHSAKLVCVVLGMDIFQIYHSAKHFSRILMWSPSKCIWILCYKQTTILIRKPLFAYELNI